MSGEGIFGIDLDDRSEFQQLMDQFRFKTIINCGGSCALKGCELDPEMAHRVNVRSVRSLLEVIGDVAHDVRLIHLSIDLVFSGTQGGGLTEAERKDPVTVYGKTMSAAEALVLEHQPAGCILRISLPMGISFNGHAGAIDWIQSRFIKGKPATLYYDEVRTPTYVECLNETLEQVVVSKMSGIYHSGGPQQLSLYQIAQIVNLVGGYDPDLLHGCYRIEAGPIPPRAGNVTMNSTKLSTELGRKPFVQWPLNALFLPDSRQWHYSPELRELRYSTPNGAASNGGSRIVDQLYRRPVMQQGKKMVAK